MSDQHIPDAEQPETPPVTRSARHSAAPKRKSRAPKIIIGTIALLVFAVAVTAGTYMWRLNSAYNQAERLPQSEVFPDAETPRPSPATPVVPANNEPLNILLLGSDTRGEVGDDLADIRGQRSDTIMVVNIPADRESVQVMSIMRDNWVEIPGHGMNKINAAMSLGGVPLLIQTIEGILDVPIDHVAIIDFEGFKGLTDALGGVTVNNPYEWTAQNGGDGTFAAGPITLDGEQALTFVRERYAFADGDYTRVRNQQAYLKGLMNGILSRETLTSPEKIVDVVDSISPFLMVDDALTVTNLVPLGLSLRDIRTADVTMFTSPTLGTGMVGAASVVHPDWDGLAELSTLFTEDRVREWTP